MPIVIHSDGESDSGSSYVGSGIAEPPAVPGAALCNWRTARFHDQECTRYFDCPSHVLERAHSDDGGPAGDHNDGLDSQDVSPVSDSGADGRPPGDPLLVSPVLEFQRRGRPLDEPRVAPSPLPVGPGTQAGPIRRHSQPFSASGPVIDLTTEGADEEAPGTPGRRDVLAGPSRRDLPTAPPPPPPPPRLQERPRIWQAGLLEPESSTLPPDRREPSDVVLPRWQPDSEVTLCPICHTQFSIFVRKHHCR